MPHPRSTGRLSPEQVQAQNDRYAQGHEYDFLFIGTGSASLTAASLLAKAGKRVCMLEFHDIPGGYAQTFSYGDFEFCAQIHYTWGCAPGGKIYAFLEKLDLEKEVEWELYDKDGYDHMVMPDGQRVKIPYGWDRLVENVEEAYPGQRPHVEKFTRIMARIRSEMRYLPHHNAPLWKYIPALPRISTLVRYKNKTLQDVFDQCGLSTEAQAVLYANAGDMMSPPEELSIFAFVGLFGGYNTGAYYPKKHYKHYIDSVAKVITDSEGSHIYYETEAVKINTEGDKAVSVETHDGKTFTAETIICGMDPQSAAKNLIGWDKFPAAYQKKLSYEYCPSGLMMYVGVKDLDLRKYGFGEHNTWHLEQWDMSTMWKEQLAGNHEKPWFFMSTPTLHSNYPGAAPEGCEIIEIATLTDYQSFKDAADRDKREYKRKKDALAEHIIDLVEKRYIPNFRDHIVMKVVGTPTTNEDFVLNPEGSAYGSKMTPERMTGFNALKEDTPWENLYWCNQSSGYPGLYGTVSTGMQLYMDLTGDRFYDHMAVPTDDELIAQIRNAQ